MNSLLRTVIVWLVLLAVPFQGFAAAAMLGCAGGHLPAPVVTTVATPAADLHAQHAMHAMHAMDDGASHAAATAHDGGDGHGMQHHGSAKCGACAACSIGAAMAPAPALALAVHAPPLLAVPFAAGHVPSVDLALPERPPRLSLA